LINHPGIVDVLDFGRDADGSPYIVMEHLQGLTVRALQRAVGPLRAGLATAIIAPALEALAAAHDAGVVHRDLKPANLFLSLQPTPSVRILDFGISKFSLGGEGVTQTGTTLGTPAYMSPEQLLDGRTVGPSADLYSMGAVLYSLLVGRPPFEADSDFAMVAQVLSKPHRPVALACPDLASDLAALVDQLLSKEPVQRPGSALQLRERLLQLAPPETTELFELAARHVSAPAPAALKTATPSRDAPTRPARPSSLTPTGPEAATVTDPPPRRGRARWLAAALVLAGVVAVGATWARREVAPPLPSAGLEALVGGGAQPASEGVDGGATFAQYVPMMEQARALAADGGLTLAITLLDDEVKRAERSNDRRAEAFALRNRGNLAQDLGRCAESAALFLRALKLFEQLRDQAGVGLLANDIGILGLSCEEIDRVNWFSLAVRARWNARDLVGVRRSANNLGVSYLNLGDFDNADRAYNEALIAATELKDELAIMRIRSNMAFVQALLAAGSSRDAGPSGLIIDKGSVAWRRAKTNFDLSLATALDAGLGEAEVCAGWEEYSVTCALLAH
jgi:hypothetical protein